MGYDKKQIVISKASAKSCKGHNNKVIERTFRTLKGLLRKNNNSLDKIIV